MRNNKSIRYGIVLAFISMFVFVTVVASPVYAETALPEGSAQGEETVLADPAEPDKEEEAKEPEAEVKAEEPAQADAAEVEAAAEAQENSVPQ